MTDDPDFFGGDDATPAPTDPGPPGATPAPSAVPAQPQPPPGLRPSVSQAVPPAQPPAPASAGPSPGGAVPPARPQSPPGAGAVPSPSPGAAVPPSHPQGPGKAAQPGSGAGASPVHPQAQPPKPIAHKEYYSISEVCELVGLKPHVLRYWESQFPVLNPSKNRSGNRVYQRKEIKLVLLVQHLLYKEKYTIEGARQRLEQLRRGGELSQATSAALDSEMRKLLREELQQLLQVLSPGRGG